MRWTIFGPIMAATLVVAGPRVYAGDFPTKPVRIIVPYAAGGPSDTGARLVLDGLSRALGKPVYVENRGGGGGLNGTEEFLAGDLDGYTLLNAGIAPLTIIPWIKQVSYVPDRDFVAIGTVWRSAQTLVVRPSLGVKTMAEFVAYAKANPGKLTIGSAGVGTVSHLGSLLLQREAGITLVHVPFRSTSESLPLLLGGQIDGLFGDASTVAPQVKAGKLMAIGVAAPERTPALPDTPTIGEAGYPAVRPAIRRLRLKAGTALSCPRKHRPMSSNAFATRYVRRRAIPRIRNGSAFRERQLARSALTPCNT